MEIKKVMVAMSSACHSVLKIYSSRFNKTMSEVMYDFARSNIQKQSKVCGLTDSILDQVNAEVDQIRIDKRIDKNCWGWMCNACKYYDKCVCGLYDGMFVPTDTAIKFPNPERTYCERQRRVRVYDHRNNKVWDPYTSKYIDVIEQEGE